MAEPRDPITAAVRATLEERRWRLKKPPTLAELVAYHEGRLAPAERERLEEALSAFPEAARTLAELAAFPEAEVTEPDHELSDEEVEADWEAFRGRLRAEGLLARRNDLPAPRGRPGPSRRSRRWIPALAAAALLALAAVPVYLSLRSGPKPRPNVPLVSLVPVTAGGERGPAQPSPPLPVADTEGGLMLQLNLVGGESFPAYRLEVRDATGEDVWTTEELRLQPDDTLTAFLPPRFLPAGRYSLELSGLEGGEVRHLADYLLVLAP